MNKICAFITILVILASLICSTYHIHLALGFFAATKYITGIVYSTLAFAVAFIILPMLSFYKATLD